MEDILPGVRELLRHGVPQGSRSRIRYLDRNGVELHLGVGAYALRDAEGVAVGHVVIFQDVSEVVRMEQELTRSERLAAVGTLSASIAHEIRNPLAAISGSIQMLQKSSLDADSEPRRLMDIAVREVDRLNQLITDFLEYARPAPLRLEVVPLEELISELARMTAVERPTLSISSEVDGALQVYADPAKLRQVIWNLLRNGAEASPSSGALRIEASQVSPQEAQGPDSTDRMMNEEMSEPLKSDWVEIAVLDQGVGIEPEVAERMFDPFFSTKCNGSGLGLSTVHRIVEEHGGSIRVDHGTGPWSTAVRIRVPGATQPVDVSNTDSGRSPSC
jgi:two-component system sensor histidine kinase PilS (NtrC family)